MKPTKISLNSTLIGLILFGSVLIGVGLFGLITSSFGLGASAEPSKRQIRIMQIIGTLFVGAGCIILPMALYFCKTSIIFSERGIQINKLFSSRIYPWHRVQKFRFDRLDIRLGRGAGIFTGQNYVERNMHIILDKDEAISVNASKKKKKKELKAAARQWVHMIPTSVDPQQETVPPSVMLDAAAVDKVQRVQQGNGENLVLRIGFKQVSGSSDFQPVIGMTENWSEQEDMLFEASGVWVVVARDCCSYVDGAVISYARQSSQKAFVFAEQPAM